MSLIMCVSKSTIKMSKLCTRQYLFPYYCSFNDFGLPFWKSKKNNKKFSHFKQKTKTLTHKSKEYILWNLWDTYHRTLQQHSKMGSTWKGRSRETWKDQRKNYFDCSIPSEKITKDLQLLSLKDRGITTSWLPYLKPPAPKLQCWHITFIEIS